MTTIRRTSRDLLAPLGDRRAGPLLVSFWTAELADGFVSVMIPIAVFAVTQDVAAVALVFLGRMLLGVLMASLGGWLADRWQRKYLLLSNYFLRVGCTIAVVVFQEQVLVFAVLGTILGSLGAFDNPAAEAGVRSVFRHDLQAVAAMRKVGQTLSHMIGPAVGGLVLGLAGVVSTLWVSVGLIAVAFMILLPAPALPAGDSPAQRGPSRSAAPIPKAPMLGAIFMATFLASFLVGIVIAAGVPHLDHAAGAPEGAYGFALACYSLGAIFGGWISGLIPWQNRHLPAVLLISAGGYGLIAAAGMIGPWWTILLSWFVWGICFGPEDILTDRYVASKTPDEALARLYARWSNIGRFGAAAAYVAMLTWGTANPTTLTLAISLAAAALAPLLIALALKRSPNPVAKT